MSESPVIAQCTDGHSWLVRVFTETDFKYGLRLSYFYRLRDLARRR